MTAADRIYAARQCVARSLRFAADRLDPSGAPRALGWSFTFEPGLGLIFNGQGRGCPVWYRGTQDYRRAHEEGWLAGGRRGGGLHVVGNDTLLDGMTDAETAEALRVLAGFPRPDERRVLSTGRVFQYDAARRLWNEAR